MPDSGDSLILKAHRSLSAIPAKTWDACAGEDNPFVSHAFLSCLEDSGSASQESGWMGQHLTLERPDGQIIGCVPLYLKNHSYGEYVFDWGWADAYERAGGRYYPKLQCSVPFTPVTGPRLLVHPEADSTDTRRALLAGLAQITEQLKVSSLHITFSLREEWEATRELGYLQRVGRQYHWQNPGYGSFQDFLDSLTSRKRKMIRKERQKVADSGLKLRHLRGDEIQEHHWAAFYEFYLNTIDRKWSQAYLTQDFFMQLGERLGEKVLLIMAEDGPNPVAGALNLIGKSALYGRNWGSLADYRFLHFEACYYQAMDFAIEEGLATVEAGAQGEHKIQRGYLPVETYSAHLISDPGLEEAIAHFLRRERHNIAEEMAYLENWAPFKKAGGNADG